MPSVRESVLVAVHEALKPLQEELGGYAVTVLRNGPLPEQIPAGGLVILMDGDPGEPEVTLSPLTWHYTHRADLLVMVQDHDGNDAAFDALCVLIDGQLTADRRLGGLCDWVEPQAPVPEMLPFEGAETIKAGRIAVLLHYATTSPLG